MANSDVAELRAGAPPTLEPLLDLLVEEMEGAALLDVRPRSGHSNEVFELRFDDGRALMLKRARHDWAEPRFAAAHAAARLLEGSRELVVPRPLDLPQELDERPLQAYWRIPLPTLEALWPRLTDEARARALHSLGQLLGRLHDVRVGRWGQPGGGVSAPCLPSYLEWDLGYRLLRASWDLWPEAVPLLRQLLEHTEQFADLDPDHDARLVHNDLHMGNVLCRVEGEEVSCVGLLDLEAAVAAPPEADAASFEVLHGPLFEQHLSPRWRAHVWRGYGRPLDARRLAFFRASHLANLGFHSALLGHDEHAGLVAQALRSELQRLERLTG